MAAKYDFSGWATKNDMRCSDGLIIKQGAFKSDNGKRVPLVYQHIHDDPTNVIGHAVLENRKDGVYAYCSFNNTEKGVTCKELVQHGDIGSLSIYANKIKKNNKDVIHGCIREVSLVLAGANPGAVIEYPVIAHGDGTYEESDEEMILRMGVEELDLEHGDVPDIVENEQESEVEEEETEVMHEETITHAEEEKKPAETSEKTVGDVMDTLTDEQKDAVAIVLAVALEEAGVAVNKEENEDMKHNAFDNNEQNIEGEVLSHAEIQQVFADAKRLGSLRDACIEHSIDTTGMTVATGSQTYGFNDASMLYPEYKATSATPEWIKRNTEWVGVVMNGVSKSPFTRIKSLFADITEDEARARGYIKGKEKKEEVFTTLKRTTDPQTVYKKQKLDRDDIIDITDFDIVSWIRGEMEMMLDEELARAILIGDGRPSDSDDKIQENHIRPIAKDVPLFNIKAEVVVDQGATDEEKAKAIIKKILKERKNYKGSGNPIFFTTEDWLTEMLLLEDGIGHRLYKSEAEVATAIRASKIVTAEVLEGQKINNKDFVGVLVNLSDYKLGADKGGEKNLFDDFDIDYNQYKYLIETRRSGALVKPFSAMTVTIEETAG